MNELKDNKPKSELVVEFIAPMEYGTVIYHGTLEKLIDEPLAKVGSKYYGIINRAKKSLLALGKAIEPLNGQGYRVINPNDYTQKAVKQFKQGFKRISRGNDMLLNAPVEQMDEQSREVHRRVSDKALQLNAAMAGGVTEIKLLAKKHPLLQSANSK